MNKTHDTWKISKLANLAYKISYPEYQREQNVWDRIAKQRLIDSIIRGFDIASLYFYVSEGTLQDEEITEFECVDGRQRINAILSFIGLNKDETPEVYCDLNFKIRISNEVDPVQLDEDLTLLQEKTYAELVGSELSKYKQKIDDYEINVVIIRDINEDKNELNLFFQRLNLGRPLNSGEKLHAMAGAMHDYIFSKDNGITLYPVFQQLHIPVRRFSKEQVAAQVVCNYFSKYKDDGNVLKPLGERGVYSRTRYYDLQLFFKEKMHFTEEDDKLAREIRENLIIISGAFKGKIEQIKNRAIAVSLILYATWLIKQDRQVDLVNFSEFFIKLIKRVNWQVTKLSKKRQSDEEYQDLFKLQSYINQAAVEEYAVAGREALIDTLFEYYLDNGHKIKGDNAYQIRTHKDPDAEPMD